MQRTLKEHISYLEQKIETLNKDLYDPGKSFATQTEIRTDLGIAECALVHFRKAFKLEQKISRSR